MTARPGIRSALGHPWLLVGVVPILLVVLGPVVLLIAEAIFLWASGGGANLLRPVVFDHLVNTVVLGLLTAAACLFIGERVAFALHRRRFAGRRLAGMIYVLPLLIPPHIHAVAWLRIIGNTGWLARWMESLGIGFDVRKGVLDIGGEATIYPGAVFIMAAAFWPIATLILSAGMARLNPAAEETVLLLPDGARRRRRLLGSMLLPHRAAAFLLVFLFAIACYPVPVLLDTPTIMQQIFFPTSNVDARAGAVVALPLAAVSIAALLLCYRLGGKRLIEAAPPRGEPSCVVAPRSMPAGLLTWAWLLFACGWPILALYAEAAGGNDAPVTMSAAYAWCVELLGQLWSTVRAVVNALLSFDAGALDADPFLKTTRAVFSRVRENILNSLIVAGSAAVLMALGAGVITLWLARRRGAVRGLVEAASLLPFAFPAVLVGVALNLFWSRFHGVPWIDRFVYNGGAIAVMAPFVLFLPFAVRSLSLAVAEIPRSAVEAAELAGAGPFKVFRRVLFPLLAPGFAAAFALGFVLGIGELAAGLIAAPGDWQSAQVRIFNMIHFARDDEVAALCLIVAWLALLPLLLYRLLFNRRVEVL